MAAKTSPSGLDAAQVRHLSQEILNIFTLYSLNKFGDSDSRLAAGTETFLACIGRYVSANQRVLACLPAFPFKSANKVQKVLGTLPDKAEELALHRLNTICESIQEIYPPGAEITIISDGITYNDLLSISDQETWNYGEALRFMATEKGFTNIAFSRIKDLLDLKLFDDLREITYVANCTNFRRLLINKHGREDLNIDQEIAKNPDTKLTYLGYRRFLENDLRHIFPPSPGRTKNGYKRDVKYLAKEMLKRGYAFAGAVKLAFPDHLRLSIHESVGDHKVSLSLLNTMTGYTTPWHCCVAQLADGEWLSAPKENFESDPRLELVYENERPSHFKEIASPEDTSSSVRASWAKLGAPKSVASSAASSEYNTSTPGTPNIPSTPLSRPASADISTSGSISSVDFENELQKAKPTAECPVKLEQGSYGKRLIPQIMDALAAEDPGRVVFTLTTMNKNKLDFRNISARSFVNAVDRTAWWLLNQVGQPDYVRPIGYIGPHDLRHILLTYACVKVGYAALYLSPKNNTKGALAVLEALGCNIWTTHVDAESVNLVKAILEERPMTVVQMPTLEELLSADSVEPFPYTKTWELAFNDPFCYLHTSGSTGVPKPIPWSHALIGTMDAIRLLPPVTGDGGLEPWTKDWNKGDRIYSSFPMSHGAGIIMNILLPALLDLQCIMGPTGVIPNIHLVDMLAEQADIDIWSMVPSLVDELGETPDVLEHFTKSKFICASGGPVSPVSAGKANEVIRVLNLTGTTEGLFIGNLVVPREDWFWFAFHPYSGFEFKEVDPGTFEHWIHRNQHADMFQGIYHTFPEKDSINFKDLYKQHPTKPNFWAFKGRNDDLVVLSNGYKISPLETEAFITTHPAVNGCLVIGTGKPQAALLIELKDTSIVTDELLDSIWATVQQANLEALRLKNQLIRDFVTLAQADKPFIRTDKGTIKRQATVALYAEYIDRFYESRSEDVPSYAVDTTSAETVQEDLREIFASSLPTIHKASAEDDLFHLGLDSLGVFAAIKAIRAATGLGDALSPRHVYANPTLGGLSECLAKMAADDKLKGDSGLSTSEAKLAKKLAKHRAHQSFRLNCMDYVNPNHYMGLMFYFPLAEGVSFEKAFDVLNRGLNRTFDLVPALGGKMTRCSPDEIGFVKGDLCVSIPPPNKSDAAHNRLIFKDISTLAPSFAKLQEEKFAPSCFPDDLVLQDDPFPKLPADVVIAQANFVEGGCLLAVDMNHCCMDGMGVMIALKIWAENCRFLQGDASATCSWFDPESFNHSLPEILHEDEGWTKPLGQVDPGTWNFLPFQPEEDPYKAYVPKAGSAQLPRPLDYKLHTVWPLPWPERPTTTTVFSISAANLKKMKKEVGQETNGTITSISDIAQAFFWQSALRARYRAAKEIHGKAFSADDISILELPTDGRSLFSSQLPETYMGSMLIMSRSGMPIEKLCSSETAVGQVANVLRETASSITPTLVHDAFTILESLPDHVRFSTANMGLDHMHAMISNLMLFPLSGVNFGSSLFANNGSPEEMRPLVNRGNGRFRFFIINPIRKDGSVEFVLGTHPEELKMLQEDEQFVKYAELVDVHGQRQSQV